jgi:hypothetical protein
VKATKLAVVAVLLVAPAAWAQRVVEAGPADASTSTDATTLDGGSEADHITTSGCAWEFSGASGPALIAMACIGMISVRFLRSRKK